MIVSRDAELRGLEGLLTDLLRGRGRALVLHGDAGIGKTTMLDALADRAADRATVLRARGVESEAGLLFSAVGDLLEPVLGELPSLPPAQAAALAAALALGPPAPGDRLAVCVAALAVVRAAARWRPVLLLVDDLQWVDASSRECIEFIARRAGRGVGAVLAARDP